MPIVHLIWCEFVCAKKGCVLQEENCFFRENLLALISVKLRFPLPRPHHIPTCLSVQSSSLFNRFTACVSLLYFWTILKSINKICLSIKNDKCQALLSNGILELALSLPSQVPHFGSLFARSLKKAKWNSFMEQNLQNWSTRCSQVDVSNSHIMVSAWSDSSFMSRAIRVWSMAPYTLLPEQCTHVHCTEVIA